MLSDFNIVFEFITYGFELFYGEINV